MNNSTMCTLEFIAHISTPFLTFRVFNSISLIGDGIYNSIFYFGGKIVLSNDYYKQPPSKIGILSTLVLYTRKRFRS